MSLTQVTNRMIFGAEVNVQDYMTSAEISAVLAYSFLTDVTAACQAALDAARAGNKNCYFPAGGYLVTTLTIPGQVSGGFDDRDSGMRIYGQGQGEPFATINTGGTIIKSVTNTPVIKDILDTNPSSNGTVEVDNIRFDGTSTTPVVLLESFYGLSSFHNNTIYQRGTGGGMRITYAATVRVYENYALNSAWASIGLGAARTGIGFDFPITHDSGLVSFYKNTSRGWLTGYQLGGGAGVEYSPSVKDCECSVVYNGIILAGTNKAIIDGCYFEGIEGGVGITNNATYSTITNNLIFSGSIIAIDSRYTTNKGAVITGNAIGMGAVVGAYGIAIGGTGYGQTITGNMISCADGTANQIGVFVDIVGKADVHANMFDPRQTWTGSGAGKVGYTSTSIINGIITAEGNDADFPLLSGSAAYPSIALTHSDVAANVLTISGGSYFVMTAGSAVTINSLSAGTLSGRLVTFRTANANATFADTAYIFSSGAFTGPGTITFLVDYSGGQNYAYEVSRTVF